MSKILRRFLVILIILIGVIVALPKSEKAGLYDEYFDDKVGQDWDHRVDFSNNGTKKWYCLEKNIPIVGYGEKKVVLSFTYNPSINNYEITYDMGNGEHNVLKTDPAYEILWKIADLASVDQNEKFFEGVADTTPYNNVQQVALWYILQNLKVESLGVERNSRILFWK